MGVSSDISKLINDIGKGMSESAIRTRLTLIEDQAKAQETEVGQKDAVIARKDSKIAEQEKQLTQLHLEIHKQEQTSQSNRLKKGAEEILKILFKAKGSTGVDVLARSLKIEEGEAQYHCDVLYEKEMADFTGFGWVIVAA